MNKLKNKYFATIFIIYTIIVPSFGSNVPVLIWGGGDSLKSMPTSEKLFYTTSQAELTQVITKRVGDSLSPVLVFYRDNLCNEDVTLHEKDHLKPFKSIGSFQYIRAVESPLSVVENLPFYNQSTEEEPESVSDGQLIKTRVTDLDTMFDTFKIIKESSPNLIGIFTGKSCARLDRVRRAVTNSPTEKNETEPILIVTNRLLFYMEKSPTLQIEGSELVNIGKLSKNATEKGDGTLTSPLMLEVEFSSGEAGGNRTRLEFEIKTTSSGYYKLQMVKVWRNDNYMTTLSAKSNVEWPRNFSYHCTQYTTFYNETGNYTAKLNLENMQIQVDSLKFGDTWDCVGFTSIAIWSGIFVTTILAIIMIWGLTMMLDIRTMDRFDDPKGKTITISSTE